MKEIIGYIKEVTYGKVQISVPDRRRDTRRDFGTR